MKKLHEKTQKEKESKEKIKKDRKSVLQSRLKKVRDRKRLKLGLPIIDSDDETVTKEEAEEASKDDLGESVLKALKDIREKEEEAKRKLVVRDWDLGKKDQPILNIKPTERKVMDQKEWVQTKRSERPTEFAPPVNLYKDQESGHTASKKSVKSFNSVPPPSTDYPQPVRTARPDDKTSTFQHQVPFQNCRPGTSQNNFCNMPPPANIDQRYPQPVRNKGFNDFPPNNSGPETSHVPPPGYQQPPQSSNFASVPPPGYQQPRPQSSNFPSVPPEYQVAPPPSSNFGNVPPLPGYKNYQGQKNFIRKNNSSGPAPNKLSSFETMYEVPEEFEEQRKVPEKVISSSLSKSSRLELHKQMVGGSTQPTFR